MKNNLQKWATIFPAALWFMMFFVLPFLIILFYSFCTSKGFGEIEYRFTLENYQQIFQNDLYFKPVLRSLKLAFCNTLLCLLIGYPFAYFIATRSRGKNFFLMLVMLPFWTSFLIRTYSWMVILRPGGALNSVLLSLNIISEPLDLLYNETAVMVGLFYSQLPFMVLPLYASIEKVDRTLLLASRDLGASTRQMTTHVLLPLTKPGIVTGSILVFVLSFGSFIESDLLGGSKSLLIGNSISDQFGASLNWPFGSALSLVIMAMVLSLLMIYIRFTDVEEKHSS